MSGGARLWVREPLAAFDPRAELERPGSSPAGGVVVQDGWIVEAVPAGGRPEHDEVFDARGLVLLPGLINTHHHFYQTLTRAFARALDKPLFPWLEALYPVWAGLTPEMIDAATAVALAELMLSGCSTATDHHYVFHDRIEDAIDRQMAVAQRLGMRTVLTRGSMSLGQRDGGLPPDTLVQPEAVILEDSLRLIERWHDPAPGALRQVALAPCSPFSVSAGLMRDTAALAAEHGVLLHTHLAETADETAFCLERYGERPLDYLARLGWLTDRTWLAHGIHFDAGEIRRLGAHGVGICHCPSSNMVLGSGQCPVPALEAAGVPVGLGVDGSASNDVSNMMQEVRQALLLQRLAAPHRPGARELAVSHRDALRWGTLGGARLLRRPELGHLGAGAAADLALFDLDELRFSGSDDPVAALVLCGAHRVRHLMIDGHWRVRDGLLQGEDPDALRRRHEELAAALRGLATAR